MEKSRSGVPNHQLRSARELRGWTRAYVAEEIGLADPKTIGRWERGVSAPNPHFSQRLCNLFGKSSKELSLLQRTNNEQPEEKPGLPSTIESISSSIPTRFLYDPAIPFAGTPCLIGRDKLLRSLKQRLCSNKYLICLALHGLPGVGKTTLSAALAHDNGIQAHFQHGVLWARVGLKPNVLGLLSRWGTLLHMPAAQMEKLTTYEAWAESIRTTINTRQILFIIDDVWNIEHALAFKVGGPNCAYLMTTRFQDIALQFASRDAISLPELNTHDGLAMLSCFVPDLVSSELSAAQDLVHLVGGLPLALTLMGKYLQKQAYSGQPRRVKAAIERLQCAEERLQLTEPQTLLERNPSLPAETPLSLQAVIGASDLQLDVNVRAVLYALAIFPAKPNSFSEEAALAVSAIPVEVLDSLTDTGLLESSGPGRYALHQTIVDYAHTKDRDKRVEERLVTHIARYMQQQGKNYETLDLESANILVALDLAYKVQMFPELVQTICAFAPFLYMRGLYTLAEEQLIRAYEIALMLEDKRDIIQTLYLLGELMRKSGNYVKAEAFLKEGLHLARQFDYVEQISNVLGSLAVAVELQGHYVEAEAYYLEGLTLARQLNLHEQISRLLADLGILVGQQGNYVRAEVYLKEALVLDHQIGLRERTSAIFTALGWVTTEQGNYEQAEAYLKEGLALACEIGSHERIGGLLWALGGAAVDQGHYAQAEIYLKEGLALARSTTLLELASELLLKLGIVATDQGDYAQAETSSKEALNIARQLGHNKLICEVMRNLGVVAAKQGNTIQAVEYLQEGLALARQFSLRELICAMLSNLGERAIIQENYVQAEAYLQEGLTLARQLGHCRWTSTLLSNLSMLAATGGNYGQAETYLDEGLSLARQLGVPLLICTLLDSQGEYYLKLQQSHTAAASFSEMLSHAPDGCQELIANAQYGLARVAAMQNNVYEARQLGKICLAIFERLSYYRAKETRYWLDLLLPKQVTS